MFINSLEIHNFKSIERLKINCKKINVFIGKPNTGKTNILETLSLFSLCGIEGRSRIFKINRFVRMKTPSNLFFNSVLNKSILIFINSIDSKYDEEVEYEFKLSYNSNFDKYIGLVHKKRPKFNNFRNNNYNKFNNNNFNREKFEVIKLRSNLRFFRENIIRLYPPFKFIKYYNFTHLTRFFKVFPIYLLPPNGENLYSVVSSNEEIKKSFKEIFDYFNFNIVFNPLQKSFGIQKRQGEDIIEFPYELISESIQCLAFYLTAVESNKNSVIAFEEPEFSTFSTFINKFAEKIVKDKNNNQFFMTVKNPYLLKALIEESKGKDIQVFIVYLNNRGETQVKELEEEQMKSFLDPEEFFNLDSFK